MHQVQAAAAPGGAAPAVPRPAGSFEVIIRDLSGNEVHAIIKPSTRLHHLLDSYCARQALDRRTVKFFFEGSRVDLDRYADSRPADLGIEEGDVIECVSEQIGD
uniref:Rad60/SUMO-like domain-containing protein n=1 Tax=Chlamydomonas leiostraca TaxID=1034604 RepID=A0A7S0RB33_9CHLO|mmetsp:Transcript_17775/g.44839  ORF Transcript_17775/g.44839 Transcript_17775/m.44839 type:complete len:104 (+) Transcript_17775:108-419(+)